MKRQTLIATALAALIAPAFAADIALPEHAHPEGVVFDVAGNLYVTSMGRGAVDRVRPGADAAEPFIAPGSGGLMGAQGGRIDEKRGLLYVCSSHNGANPHAKKGASALKAFARRRQPARQLGLARRRQRLLQRHGRPALRRGARERQP